MQNNRLGIHNDKIGAEKYPKIPLKSFGISAQLAVMFGIFWKSSHWVSVVRVSSHAF